MQFIDDVMIKKLGYNNDDFIPMCITDADQLYKMRFNGVECGLLYVSRKDKLDRETHILSTMIQKDTSLDFFILTNKNESVVIFTDHNNSLIPQYIDMQKGYNRMELICGKIFMKNLISNRGVEYYA